ncbi:MAG: LPS assembly lipoprotein LptE [Candidatus Hinthialibacter antarcticus]|nr:LPS assembly lipoprotein LptE [Candidatus Hinthialibacter antarcticus]
MKQPISLCLIAAFALILASCGAHSPRLLDEQYATMHISVVENQTFEVALEESFTRDLIKVFKRDGRLRLATKSNADLQMTATISKARIYPLAFSDLDRAVGYSLDVVLLVTVEDSSGDLLLNQRPFVGSGVQMITQDESAGGLQNVSEQIASDVLSFLLEGW